MGGEGGEGREREREREKVRVRESEGVGIRSEVMEDKDERRRTSPQRKGHSYAEAISNPRLPRGFM